MLNKQFNFRNQTELIAVSNNKIDPYLIY